MKLVTFCHDNTTRLGAFIDGTDSVLDLQRALTLSGRLPQLALRSMQALIDSGAAGLQIAAALIEACPEAARLHSSALRLLAPLPVPVQVRDFMCFEIHARNAGFCAAKLMASLGPDPAPKIAAIEAAGPLGPAKVWYEQPVYYKGNRFAIAGTGEDVHWPAHSSIMDYELEFAVVIGREGRDIAVENAREHIFGYTIYNDFSARDLQFKEMAGMMGPAKGKDFDGGTILGPCIVTRDELANAYDLDMTAKVNGEIWSRGNSGTIRWTFEQMIAHVSQGETIYPGEIFGSGTVGGGCGLEQMRFLQDGDIVELSVAGIGTISNRVVAPHIRAL